MMEFPNFQVCDRDLSDSLLSYYLTAEAIAVDTETMGLMPWRDRLCLVQLCNPEGKVTVVRIAINRVQPLGIVPVVAKSIVHSTHFLFPQAQISVKRGVKRETVWRCCGYLFIYFLSLF